MTKEKWISVGRGAIIAIVGAAIASIAQSVTATDLGPFWGPMFVAVMSVAANVLRKYTESDSELKVN